MLSASVRRNEELTMMRKELEEQMHNLPECSYENRALQHDQNRHEKGERQYVFGVVFPLQILVNISLVLLWSLTARAVDEFNPIPLPEQAFYHVPSTRYYANASARQKDEAEVTRLADNVAALRQSVASDPSALLRALQENAVLRVPLDRLWIHALVLSDQDTDNSALMNDYNRLENAVNEKTAFLQTVIGDLPDATLTDFQKREPGLAAFNSTFVRWRRARPHRLPEAAESAGRTENQQRSGPGLSTARHGKGRRLGRSSPTGRRTTWARTSSRLCTYQTARYARRHTRDAGQPSSNRARRSPRISSVWRTQRRAPRRDAISLTRSKLASSICT